MYLQQDWVNVTWMHWFILRGLEAQAFNYRKQLHNVQANTMDFYQREAVHGKPCMEGCIFLYQVPPTKCVLLSKCKLSKCIYLACPFLWDFYFEIAVHWNWNVKICIAVTWNAIEKLKLITTTELGTPPKCLLGTRRLSIVTEIDI